MRPLQFYKYTTWGLLALNLLALGFFILNRPPAHGGMRAIDALKLDEKQHREFLISAKKHEGLINEVQLQQKELLRTYFNQLVTSTTERDRTNSLMMYEELESQKIKVTYQHFKEIKDLLRQDQLADFESFITRMLKRILINSQRNDHPPKDF